MTTIRLGTGPGQAMFLAANQKAPWYNTGWFSDAMGATSWAISSIFPQRAPYRTGRDVLDTSTFGDYVPYILAGGLALFVVIALSR